LSMHCSSLSNRFPLRQAPHPGPLPARGEKESSPRPEKAESRWVRLHRSPAVFEHKLGRGRCPAEGAWQRRQKFRFSPVEDGRQQRHDSAERHDRQKPRRSAKRRLYGPVQTVLESRGFWWSRAMVNGLRPTSAGGAADEAAGHRRAEAALHIGAAAAGHRPAGDQRSAGLPGGCRAPQAAHRRAGLSPEAPRVVRRLWPPRRARACCWFGRRSGTVAIIEEPVPYRPRPGSGAELRG